MRFIPYQNKLAMNNVLTNNYFLKFVFFYFSLLHKFFFCDIVTPLLYEVYHGLFFWSEILLKFPNLGVVF